MGLPPRISERWQPPRKLKRQRREAAARREKGGPIEGFIIKSTTKYFCKRKPAKMQERVGRGYYCFKLSSPEIQLRLSSSGSGRLTLMCWRWEAENGLFPGRSPPHAPEPPPLDRRDRVTCCTAPDAIGSVEAVARLMRRCTER